MEAEVIPWMSNIAGIVAGTLIAVQILKNVLGKVPVAQYVPTWCYAVLIAALLTVASAAMGWLEGNLVTLLWTSVSSAAAASGFWSWLHRIDDTPAEYAAEAKKPGSAALHPLLFVCGAGLLMVGCGITEPIKSTSLTAAEAKTVSDAGPSARVPTFDGEAITINTLAGLDVYNVDGEGIYGGSSQPKTVTVLPLGDRNMFSASPSDTRIGRIQIEMVDGQPVTVVIEDYEARVSDPIAALDTQVIAVLETTRHLSTEERIRKIEQMRIAGDITAAVAEASVRAIIAGVTGMP